MDEAPVWWRTRKRDWSKRLPAHENSGFMSLCQLKVFARSGNDVFPRLGIGGRLWGRRAGARRLPLYIGAFVLFRFGGSSRGHASMRTPLSQVQPRILVLGWWRKRPDWRGNGSGIGMFVRD